MNLKMDIHLADGYKAPSQRARRITEGWFAANMYCPACPSVRLSKTVDNTKVVDFVCSDCGAEYQLKAKSGAVGKKLRDAAYQPMMERIAANRSPHFAFLAYDARAWTVRNLLLVPGHFLTPASIERCPPLRAGARRAGWIGCNILTDRIPREGKIPAVFDSSVLPMGEVRVNWARFSWLAGEVPENRGWTADVLRCVNTFGRSEFTLQQMYEFAEELAMLHPGNRNVQPKIRQQLQILRNRGIVRFLGKGRYRNT